MSPYFGPYGGESAVARCKAACTVYNSLRTAIAYYDEMLCPDVESARTLDRAWVRVDLGFRIVGNSRNGNKNAEEEARQQRERIESIRGATRTLVSGVSQLQLRFLHAMRLTIRAFSGPPLKQSAHHRRLTSSPLRNLIETCSITG
jgi:hypothetical protein